MAQLVYGAVYSGVPVFEMNCRQVAVMRRKSDSYLNATQILKAAGVEKGRRTKILERQVQTGVHEKVQGGYGKYQGTWIPFERGVEIARQFGVEDLLRPILDHVAGDGVETATTVLKKRSRASSSTAQSSSSSTASSTRGRSMSDMQQQSFNVPIQSTSNVQPTSIQPASIQPTSIQSMASSSSSSSSMQLPTYSFYPNNNQQQSMPSVAAMNGERYRAILMSVFLNHESQKLPDLLTTDQPPEDFNVDLVIDDQGHTALHWAAALARLPVVRALLNLGADAQARNSNGETALMRAVLVSNNFDADTFEELVDMLRPCIPLLDKKDRSVFHHVALTAGIRGRIQTSRFYLETLLAWMRAHGVEYRSLVDLQDTNGDSALNIAARIGNRHLVEMLLKVGADPGLPNRAGLRPCDFGLEDERLAGLFAAAAAAKQSMASADTSVFESTVHVDQELHHQQEQQLQQQDKLREALMQIDVVTKQLAESRAMVSRLLARLSTVEQENAVYRKQFPHVNGVPESESIAKLEKEVSDYRALLCAHGIPVNEHNGMLSGLMQTNTGEMESAPLIESKINQILASALDVSVQEAVAMADPLLAALTQQPGP